ncbi:hypothetical protein A1O3_03888 [Capronia epimyces CBS 606.96]|uniref:Major facilitator superfamily (MFS) profile domain-containing protein n=1 Tax=Capronia epimyces CBS 606.96 TaxID=1182542 RepID=W9YXC0_9EURO|nr:uncharacterized protein A1O3_03888 [Capronia epimyces CBS 606.96]EXJ86934.1 hypothetical protein A1O3_03888 [Capronia epimyces CBS 606.96]
MGKILPSISLYNWAIVMLMALGTTSVSYALSSISGALGQASFYVSMDLVGDATAPGYAQTSNYIAACTGCLLAGGFAGVLFNAWAADILGRRLACQVGAVVLTLGGALQGGATNRSMLLGGRFVAGLGMGALWTTIPMYQAEISTPQSRGFMVSMTGVMFALGYMLSGWINFATYYAGQKDPSSTFPWRFPLAFQAAPALVMLLFSPLLPESPRWLLQKDRHGEALAITRRLHHSKTDINDSFARREYIQMSKQMLHDTRVQQQIGSFYIFRTASNRKRCYLAFGLLWGCQWMGLTVVGTYGVLVYSSLGMTGSLPLLLQALWVTISLPGNSFTALYVDRVGRRTLLLIGAIAILVCLCFNTALQAEYLGTSNRAGQRASIFFIFLMIVFWAGCVDATQFVYLSEIWPSHLRAQGQTLGMAGWMLSGIILLVAAPIAMDHIGWKFTLINICCTFVFVFCLYFFYPETRGKSIEDINALFGDEVVLHLEDATDEEGDMSKEGIVQELEMEEGSKQA